MLDMTEQSSVSYFPFFAPTPVAELDEVLKRADLTSSPSQRLHAPRHYSTDQIQTVRASFLPLPSLRYVYSMEPGLLDPARMIREIRRLGFACPGANETILIFGSLHANVSHDESPFLSDDSYLSNP